MKWIKFLTEEQYEQTKASFRDMQKKKQRYNYHGDTVNWEWTERTTKKKMTNTTKKLQEEYDKYEKEKRDPKTIYFVINEQ